MNNTRRKQSIKAIEQLIETIDHLDKIRMCIESISTFEYEEQLESFCDKQKENEIRNNVSKMLCAAEAIKTALPKLEEAKTALTKTVATKEYDFTNGHKNPYHK